MQLFYAYFGAKQTSSRSSVRPRKMVLRKIAFHELCQTAPLFDFLMIPEALVNTGIFALRGEKITFVFAAFQNAKYEYYSGHGNRHPGRDLPGVARINCLHNLPCGLHIN